jgi:hypothetical protein
MWSSTEAISATGRIHHNESQFTCGVSSLKSKGALARERVPVVPAPLMKPCIMSSDRLSCDFWAGHWESVKAVRWLDSFCISLNVLHKHHMDKWEIFIQFFTLLHVSAIIFGHHQVIIYSHTLLFLQFPPFHWPMFTLGVGNVCCIYE